MKNLLAAASCLVALVAASAPLDLSVRTYNAPGQTAEDTYRAIRRRLAGVRFQKREELKGNTTLDRSWDGAVLLKFGLSQEINTTNEAATLTASQSVEIVCTQCYIKGQAFAELKIPDNFDASDALNNTVTAVSDEIANFSTTVQDYLGDYIANLTSGSKFKNGVQLSYFAFPPLNFSFDVDIKPIDEVTLDFTFNGMELYLQMNTILGAGLSYELNLYTSNTPIGMGVGKDMMIGVVFKVDLLLSVEGSIDISSGLHIKLDDGFAINIALFSDKVSEIIFNGGQFEFLPVTVQSAGVILKAALRIGIHSGVSIATPDTPSFIILNKTLGIPTIGSGIEVGVFANLAEFTTNVTLVPNNPECELKVVQEYQMALGAAAGASIVFDTDTWGPVAETSIPIWNTELASVCAIKGTKMPASASATPTVTARAVDRREDLDTQTITTKIIHTGVRCKESMAGNCPASMQETTQSTETSTLVTAVPSGETAKFPESVKDAVTSTVAFGSNVQTFTATSGSPTSYTPPPPTSTSKDEGGGGKIDKALNGKTGGVSNKVIVGVSVGVGVPVIVGIIAALVLMRRRKRYNAVSGDFSPNRGLVSEPYGHDGRFEPYRPANKPAKPSLSVSQISH